MTSVRPDKALLPCATCPWRTDQDAATIPGYDHAKACGLMNTVGSGDAFRPIMACHGSPEGKERACRGYLAREGWTNLNVRLLAARSQVENPDEVAEACERHGVELEPDYPAVLAKLAGSISG